MTARRIIRFLLRGYQLTLSPFVGQHCRFYPSCSEYAIQAVESHGALRGLWLSLRRLLRCHPWHPGGVDPVPPAADASRCRPASSALSCDKRPTNP